MSLVEFLELFLKLPDAVRAEVEQIVKNHQPQPNSNEAER